jgi:MraZ protein
MPQHLKEAAGLEKDVVVAGAGTRVEIWDTKKYEKQSKGVDIDKVSKAMLDLGFSI